MAIWGWPVRWRRVQCIADPKNEFHDSSMWLRLPKRRVYIISAPLLDIPVGCSGYAGSGHAAKAHLDAHELQKHCARLRFRMKSADDEITPMLPLSMLALSRS